MRHGPQRPVDKDNTDDSKPCVRIGPSFGGPNPNFSGGPNPNFSGGPNPNFSGGPTPNFSGGPNPNFSGGPNPNKQPRPAAQTSCQAQPSCPDQLLSIPRKPSCLTDHPTTQPASPQSQEASPRHSLGTRRRRLRRCRCRICVCVCGCVRCFVCFVCVVLASASAIS